MMQIGRGTRSWILSVRRCGSFLRTGSRSDGMTTSIHPMRATPAVWVKREGMLARVHWIDGAREDLEEDYGPKWYIARELLRGNFETTKSINVSDVSFAAKPVVGVERDRLWTNLKHSE